MSHRIETAKSGRAKCVTCESPIPKGEARLAEQHEVEGLTKLSYRFHHLGCALAQLPDLVSQAQIEPECTIDRADLARRLVASLELHRKARREAYTALLAAESATPAVLELLDDTATQLLDQLAASPDDEGILAVLADALQSQGEPRGELIAIQLRLKSATPADVAVLVRRRDDLMLQLSPPLAVGERCAWGIGFVRRVELAAFTGTRLAELATLWRHPSMRIASEVQLELGVAYHQATMTAAFAGIRAHLRRLVLDTAQRLESLAELVAGLPRLAQLVVHDSADFDRLAHPELRRLVLRSLEITQLPDVVPRLSPGALPQLTELGLRGTRTRTDDVCEALATSHWLRRLDQLDLCNGTLTERGIQALADGLGGRRLALLDVTGNPMAMTLRTPLAKLCEQLVFPDQLEPTGPVFVTHRTKPEWGRGTLLRRYDGKLEVEFPNIGRKIFRADAPFLELA
ncbi:MAG: DUF3553 domain-containing protein [Kofleriaceae bacterium]